MKGKTAAKKNADWPLDHAVRRPRGKKEPQPGPAEGDRAVRSVRYDDKLNAVLAASAALFAERGYERTTVRDVAQTTGMSLAGLYYYFGSKEELLFLIQRHTFDSLVSRLRAIVDKEQDPGRLLRGMIRMHIDYFVEHMNDLKVCSREIDSLNGDFQLKVAERRREYFDLAQSIFERLAEEAGGAVADSRHAALYLFGTLNWIYQWYRPGRSLDVAVMTDQLTAIYLGGFPNPPGGGAPGKT